MSSASRLFSRRPRQGRNSDDTLQQECDRDWDQPSLHNRRLPSRQKCRSSRNRVPGPSRAINLCRSAPPQEFGIFSSDTAESTESSTGQREITTIGLSYNRSDRLPGAVLEARARLLERLRGVSLPRHIQRSTIDAVPRDEFSSIDDFTVSNSGGLDSDPLLERFDLDSPHRVFPVQESSLFLQNVCGKPPGLGLDSVGRLQREVFKDVMVNNAVLLGSVECSICLEKFSDGDELIRLPCRHKFHPACLTPWIKICGDCPYCRTNIVGGQRSSK